MCTCTLLDLVHHSWGTDKAQPLDSADWGEVLADQLMIMRDVARDKGLHIAEARKSSHVVKVYIYHCK